MEIYSSIRQVNLKNKTKIAVSMTMDSGVVKKYNYETLFTESEQYAAQLEISGIRQGDRVILVAENSPQWQMAFLGIMKLKATAVLIDASLGAEDLKSLIEKSDARCIYTSEKVKEKLGDSAPYRVPIMNLDNGGRPFKDSYKVLSPFIPKTEDGDPNIALIIYSSGTTRSAAGIMHTHDAMIKTIRMITKENDLTSRDRILSILPNSHIYGVVTCLLGSMLLGASLHYVESISNENILSAFETFKPTVFPCVPKVFELFEKQIVKKIESKEFTKRIYEYFYPICERVRQQTGIKLGKMIFKSVHKGFGGRLRLMTSAGAPLDEKAAAFYYALGFDLLITYGLTETNIPVIGNRGENITIDSCGKTYPRIEVILAHPDETGEGEIYIRSPYMMQGYFRDEEATKAAFDEDGWFKTGDLARVDEKGNVKITGRSKENIVLATGKKVTPADIESQYTEIPGIDELVISGVPITGEYDEVHAFVVKEAPHLDENHILRSIQERGAKLSQYMKVAKVHFLEEIPKTSLQKPKRYLLKKHALEAGEQDALELQAEKMMQCAESIETCEEKVSAEQVERTLRALIVKMTGLDEKLVTGDAKFTSQLGIDSLSIIEIAFQIEEKYHLSVEHLLAQDTSVQEIAHFIYHTMQLGHQEAMSSTGEKDVFKEITVQPKTNMHYMIFKAHCLLAHLLYRVKTTNPEVLPQNEGYIICANHVSNIDYLWVTQSFSKEQFLKCCCMAKKELFKESFSAKLLRDLCGMIPVDRGGMNCEVIKTCKRQLDDGWGLLIHPEGTRSQDGELGAFKKGAATIAKEAGVPIIPVYIKGGHEIFPRGRKMPKLFNWKEKCRYEVEVIYGEPIHPEQFSIEETAQKVEEAVKALIQKAQNGESSNQQDEQDIVVSPVESEVMLDAIVYQETLECESEEITEAELISCQLEEDDLEKEYDEEERLVNREKLQMEEEVAVEEAFSPQAIQNIAISEKQVGNLEGEAEEIDLHQNLVGALEKDTMSTLEESEYEEEITLKELLGCDFEIDLVKELEK